MVWGIGSTVNQDRGRVAKRQGRSSKGEHPGRAMQGRRKNGGQT